MSGEIWDNLNEPTAEEILWSTDNMGEAAPGVLSPLGWSLWGHIGERAAREALFRAGALTAAERYTPRNLHDHVLRVFCGRMAMQVQFLATVGNRMPGTTGQQVAEGIFGRIPDNLDYTATRSRYPAVAARLPGVALLTPGQVRRLARETDHWWSAHTRAAPGWDRAEAIAGLRTGMMWFGRTLTLHTLCLMTCVSPTYDLLTKLVAKAGAGDVAALSGSGGAEMAVVSDIWRASREELTLDQVVARHGFHGPAEGEVSSRVWREDRGPLAALTARYAEEPESAAPAEIERRRVEGERVARAELLAATPVWQRPAVSAVLDLAAKRIPMRGVGKRSFLQGIDGTRTAARRLGVLLAADGIFEDPDDVFYLTWKELMLGPPPDAKELVILRRARRAEYQAMVLPGSWTGTPVPIAASTEEVESVAGIGASAGVVEGRVRVLLSPDFADVEPDEVLVAPTTDPSWSAVMFISSALVVDIGSALSHAAVVARELGVPCVVNTRSGTRDLRTGDLVRVDGSAGVVTVLERA
ncbi:MAG TPA: PEP-utilizing enzyme [Acidimicrobiales bacterium]|nr:PEP-utilizing enzyme [Acidimicrobiales bacterium]